MRQREIDSSLSLVCEIIKETHFSSHEHTSSPFGTKPSLPSLTFVSIFLYVSDYLCDSLSPNLVSFYCSTCHRPLSLLSSSSSLEFRFLLCPSKFQSFGAICVRLHCNVSGFCSICVFELQLSCPGM